MLEHLHKSLGIDDYRWRGLLLIRWWLAAPKRFAGETSSYAGSIFILSRIKAVRMSKTAEADDRGRIVIPNKIREKHGDRYRIVELDDRVEMIPLTGDPIVGLRDAVGDAFDENSIAEIKDEARNAARREAIEDGDGLAGR